VDLHGYIPKCYHGNILITSRNPNTCVYATGPDFHHQISGMIFQEARELLLKSAGLSQHYTDETESLAAVLTQVEYVIYQDDHD
jgi:hypothetical protein